MRATALAATVSVILCARARAGEAGLVACWRFDEGAGKTLQDTSGNGNHGQIHGATWVRNGKAYALEFDGVDDHVDCGAGATLDLRDCVSMVAWVWLEPQTQAGEPGIVGKAYASYVLTQYGDQAWTYVSGGPHHVSQALTYGQWYHLASTYDGKHLRLYVDGQLAVTTRPDLKIASGGHFWMGRSDGELKYTRNAHFRGKITDVRVYSRALSIDEVRWHARTTNLSGVVSISPIAVPTQGKLLVELDTRGLGAAPADATVDVELLRPDAEGRAVGAVLRRTSVDRFDARHKAVAGLSMRGLESGEYLIRARATGTANTARVAWTAPHAFPRGPEGAKQLNNLVTELLHVRSDGATDQSHSFVNARRGWVLIANHGAAEVSLTAKGETGPQRIRLDQTHAGAHEAMRLLPAGEYAIRSPRVDRLVVLAVPEIVFARYDSNPHVTLFGPYRGEFHRRHVFKNVNTFVGQADEPFAEEWKRRGGRWLVRCGVPKDAPDKPLTVDAAYRFLVDSPAFRLASVDGLIADEFGNSAPYCATWAKAVDRALGETAYRDKLYYPYANDLWDGAEGRELTAVLVKRASAIAWKRYLKEQRTEPRAWRFLNDRLVRSAEQYRTRCPGSLPHLVVCFGYFSAPPEQLDTFPHVNYKTYLDMQFNVVANHPALEGVGGVMSYLASYVDEETVRWMTKLFRHYAVQGRTEMLGTDPYVLTHLKDPDFERQGDGWLLSPANKESIRFGTSPGLGWLEGRYPRTSEGDTVIVLRRSADRPNTFGQEIRDLQPGRVYSLRMFSADANDMSVNGKHGLAIRIEGADVLAEHSFTHVFSNCYSHHYGPFDRENKAWMNYHWRVFRAKGKSAKLTVSDWAGRDKPGGPVGREIMCNFVQVQPYDPR